MLFSQVNIRGRIVKERLVSMPAYQGNDWIVLDIVDDSYKNVPQGIPKPNDLIYSVVMDYKTVDILKVNLKNAVIDIIGADVFVTGILTKNFPGDIPIADIGAFSDDIKSIDYDKLILAYENKQDTGLLPILRDSKILWPTDKIEIPADFLAFTPKEEKIQSATMYYKKYGQMEKPIEVSLLDNGIVLLKDGYARYISNVRNRIFYTWINGIDFPGKNEMTTTEEYPHPFETGDKIMFPIEDIIVPEEFKLPREEKIIAAIAYYEANGEMEKPIETRLQPDGKHQMMDGYAKYLASKRLGHAKVWIIH